MKLNLRIFGMIALIALLSLGFPRQVLAHAVQTDFQVDQQSQLSLQAQYDTGDPLKYAPVEVYAPQDLTTPKLSGNTDAEGRFRVQLDPQQKGDWKVAIGEVKKSDHGDILKVSVTEQGIEVSQAIPHPRQPQNPWIVFGIAGIAGVITSRLLTRQRFWRM